MAQVKWAKIEETSTTGFMPTNALNTWNTGVNSQSGVAEFLQLRYDLTYGVSPTVTEISSLIQSLRITLNGTVVHDYTAGMADGAALDCPQYNYLINSIGGRVVEEPTAVPAVRTGYINIPLGRVLPEGVNRWEIAVTWAATAGAITSGTMSYWIRFNSNCEKMTYVAPSTSYLSVAGAYEQVIVRVPQDMPRNSVVSALVVLNDAPVAPAVMADGYGAQGIRLNALSDFGIPISMYRAQNGDMSSGKIQFNDANDGTFTQVLRSEVQGAIQIPTLGLTGGDIVCAVDSTLGMTRRFCPIITAPIGGKDSGTVRQTQAATGNSAKAILRGSLE